MRHHPGLQSLLRNDKGSALIEFALLAPLLIAMMMGVMTIGIQMQCYNAMRAIAYDVERYAVVEYQKENRVNNTGIREVTTAIAARPQYSLSGDRLTVTVTDGTIPFVGAKRVILTINYSPHDFVKVYNIGALQLTVTETIILPT